MAKKTAKKSAQKKTVKKTVKSAKKAPLRKAKTKLAEPTLFDTPAEPEKTPPPQKAAAKPLKESEDFDDLDVFTPTEPKKRKKKAGYATAETMAKSQRSISISEFFAKNRHLLGFDNPRKALLTTVKEAVDNSLDACEEAGILPSVEVRIEQISESHFMVSVQDNGPGIVKAQIPNIFGKLLYGSKFHRLRMSRGQQGIGISAAGMYGLLTTGQPVRITSKTSKRSQAHFYELQIDTRQNKPEIMKDEIVEWDVDHGTRVQIELEARYQRGRQSVDDYLMQTAIANPHVSFTYTAPDGRVDKYESAVKQLPAVPKEVKPHPHGVELGVLIKMIQDTRARNVGQFLTSEFSRVSPKVAKEILDAAKVKPSSRPSKVNGEGAKAIYHAIQEAKILAPSTDCVVPIGEEQLISGLQQVVKSGFYTAVTRRPAVYRGNPFIIEAAISYGKPEATAPAETLLEDENDEEDSNSGDSLAKIMRFANRVPLQYQQGACAITKSVLGMNWKSYGLTQSRGALPSGDISIVVHMASVWVPFTSESKEAIASYPEIIKELKLALQECGRKLSKHIRKTVRVNQELKKRSYIQKYIPAIGEALRDILALKDKQVDKVCEDLKDILEKSRKF